MYDLLNAEQRDTNGVKPFQLRKNGHIPGVVFAKGMYSIPVTVESNDFRKILAHGVKVFEVAVAGEKYLVNLESVQRDPVTHKVLHINLHKLNKNQATTVLVPVHVVGEAKGMKEGGVMRQLLDEVHVTGLPHKIPEFVEINVEELGLNEHFNVSDIKLAAGLTFNEEELEKGVVNCAMPKKEVEPEVEEALEAADGEAKASGPADGEGTPAKVEGDKEEAAS